MAFSKQKESVYIIVILTLVVVPVIATTNVDCNGKAFHCENSTHFKICVDFGGVSKTVDDFLIPCPPSTACTENNYFECEYQTPTSSAPVAVRDATNELSETTVSSWELLDVTTLFPMPNYERSVDLAENSTITSTKIISTLPDTETANIVNYTPVNNNQNEVITESDNITHKITSDLSESENNNPKPTDTIGIENNTSLPIIDETIGSELSNIPSEAIIENYSTTESEISTDLFNTIITTSPNSLGVADLKSTKLFKRIPDSLSKNYLSAVTENYLGTENEISTNLYGTIITTNPYIDNANTASTTSSSGIKTDDFSLNTSYRDAATKSASENDSLIFFIEQVITTPSNNIQKDLTSSILLSPVNNDNIRLGSTLAVQTVEKNIDGDNAVTTENYLSTAKEISNGLHESIITTHHHIGNNANIASTTSSSGIKTDDFSLNTSYRDLATKSASENDSSIFFVEQVITSPSTSIQKDLISSILLSPVHTNDISLGSTLPVETINKNIAAENAVTTENYLSTAKEISNGLHESITSITTYPYIGNNANIASTTSSSGIKTNDFSLNTSYRDLATMSASENDSSIFFVEQVITSPSTSIQKDLTSGILLSPVNTDDLILGSALNVLQTTSKIVDAENVILITSSDNKVNANCTTTTLFSFETGETPVATEKIETNFTDISDSYLASSQKDTISRYVNSPTETTANTNELYTTVVEKTSHDKVNDYYMNENNRHINTVDKISSSPQNENTSMGFLPATENVVLRNTLQNYSINNRNEHLSEAVSANSTNTDNKVISSDTAENIGLENTDTYEKNRYLRTISPVNELYTKKSNNDENINLHLDEISITKLYLPAITESSSIGENTETNLLSGFKTKLDSYTTNLPNYSVEKNTNSLTLTRNTAIDDFYTNTVINTSQLDYSMRDENALFTVPNPDSSSTDKELRSTTIAEISTKEQSNQFLRLRKEHQILSENLNNDVETTAKKSTADIGSTTNSYDLNFSTVSTVNKNNIHTDITNRTSNYTIPEFSMFDNSSNKYFNVEIMTPTLEEVDFTLGDKIKSINTTPMNVLLKQTVEEKRELLSAVTTESSSVGDLIVASLSSDLPVTEDSHVANTRQHMNVGNTEFPIPSIIDLNPQNVITEILSNEISSLAVKFDDRSTHDLAKPQYAQDKTDSDSTQSLLFNLPKLNLNVAEKLLNVSEPTGRSEVYEQTTKTDMSLLLTQASNYEPLSYTEEIMNTITVKELISSESENSRVYNAFQKNSEYPSNLNNSVNRSKSTNTTPILDKDETVNFINIDVLNTSATSLWSTINGTAVEFLSLTPTYNITNETRSIEFVNPSTTINNGFDYILTTHSYIKDGINVNSIMAEENIKKVTHTNENQSPSTVVTDLHLNANVNNTNYSITNTPYTMIKNYSSNNKLSKSVTDISLTELPNLIIPPKVHSIKVSPILPSVPNTNNTISSKADKISIYSTAQDIKNDISSNVDVIDEFSMSTESMQNGLYVDKSIDQNQNKRTEIIPNPFYITAPAINSFVTTERTIYYKTGSNILKPTTVRIDNGHFSFLNTTDRNETEKTKTENSTKINKSTKDDLQIGTLTINVTNGRPLSTAHINKNVNFTITHFNMKLDRHANSTARSDIDLTTSETNLPQTPNKGYVDNAAKNKYIPSQYIFSDKENHLTYEESFKWGSVKNDGLNIQDKVIKTAPLSKQPIKISQNDNKYLYNKTIINKYDSHHLIPDANLANSSRKHQKPVESIKDITDRDRRTERQNFKIKQLQTSDTVVKITASFDNDMKLENLTRLDRNNGYDIDVKKTRKADINTLYTNAASKPILSTVILKNENERKEQIPSTTPVNFNNNFFSDGYARMQPTFNCKNRQRGKYSDQNDCQNFYICIGRNVPIFGTCPNNTVFSEISKQCTKNLSHCIRNNQFQCTSAGRYIDVLSNKFYYICAKKMEGFIRFKLQCQKGYYLDKSQLKCKLYSLNGSTSNEDSSRTDSEKSTIESKSKEVRESKKFTKDFECKKEGKFMYPDDCRKYYQCTKSEKSEFRRKIKKCDSDEVFNHEKRKCVDEESYECKD